MLLHGGQQGGPVLQDGSRKKVSLCFLLPFLQIFDDYANDDGVLDGIASIKSSLLILGLDDEEVDQVASIAGFEVLFSFFFCRGLQFFVPDQRTSRRSLQCRLTRG